MKTISNLKNIYQKLMSSWFMPAQSEQEETTITSQITYGTVQVVRGNVIVSDPQHEGAYAVLVVPDQPTIHVYKNGEVVHGEVILMETDQVEVKLDAVDETITYQAIVSSNQMEVSVRVEAKQGVFFTLRDTPPSQRLSLPVIETYNALKLPAADDILALVNRYVGEVDYNAIGRLCNAFSECEVVLRGTFPQDGIATGVVVLKELDSTYDDALGYHHGPLVQTGEVLAVRHAPVLGISGQNVYGKTIPPKEAIVGSRLTLGAGVSVRQGQVVAARSGRLTCRYGVLEVIPELRFEENITVKQGEVSYDGNVYVLGSITDGAVVRASGMVTVLGDVDHATVFGGQGIYIGGGIYGSKIVSGYQLMAYEKLGDLLAAIEVELKRFHMEYGLMIDQALKRPDVNTVIAKIPDLLFSKRHEKLNTLLNQLLEEQEHSLTDVDLPLQEIKRLVRDHWLEGERLKLLDEDILELLDHVKRTLTVLGHPPQPKALIRAGNVSYSELQSVGNIIIKKNCFTSSLQSRRAVAVHKNIVGGFVVAGRRIYAGELGSLSGTETSVRVDDPQGLIRVAITHINTLMQVGIDRRRVYDLERDVRFGGAV